MEQKIYLRAASLTCLPYVIDFQSNIWQINGEQLKQYQLLLFCCGEHLATFNTLFVDKFSQHFV